MRIVFFLLVLVFPIFNINIYSKNQLIMSGKVVNFGLEKDKESTVIMTFEIQMKLSNIGTKKLIFLNKENYPKFNTVSIFSAEKFSTESHLATNYWGDSVDRSEKWDTLRNQLDALIPPNDLIYILKPNESWIIETKYFLSLPTEKYKNSSLSGNETWEKVQKLKFIWIRAAAESWSLNIEEDKTNLNLARKLRKRWNNYGYLWLDDIISEPIPFNLGSAITKMEEK